MKNTCIKILALSAACLVLAACSKQKPQEGFKEVSDESCDFSFEVQSDWNINYTDSMLSANDTEDNTNVTAYSFSLSTPMGADDYWDEYLTNFKERFGQDSIKVNKLEETTLSGVIARHVFYTVDMGKDSFNCETIICSRYGNIYMLTFTSTPETYQNHTEDFTNIAQSFKFN